MSQQGQRDGDGAGMSPGSSHGAFRVLGSTLWVQQPLWSCVHPATDPSCLQKGPRAAGRGIIQRDGKWFPAMSSQQRVWPARPDDTAGRRGWLLCGGAQPSLFQSCCQALSRERVSQARRDVVWDQCFSTSHTVSQQWVPQHSTRSWLYLAAGPSTRFKSSQNKPHCANLCKMF